MIDLKDNWDEWKNEIKKKSLRLQIAYWNPPQWERFINLMQMDWKKKKNMYIILLYWMMQDDNDQKRQEYMFTSIFLYTYYIVWEV